jgi:ADP-ribosylglycohydrolase
MLGKPFEIGVGLAEIRSALEAHGAWPLTDYPSEEVLRALPERQGQWRELVRGRISHVAPDDDINYTILAMLALEQGGAAFTHDDMRRLWLHNLPVAATFGPERTILVRAASETLSDHAAPRDGWTSLLNPGSELCGALIRADAYGYAALGRPKLAAALAYRDASFTHRRTGIYGAIVVAGAIAATPHCDTALDAIRTGLELVPPNSRLATRAAESLELVASAPDWLAAYERVHARFGEFGFCRIHQELGTVMVTARFATDVGDGICKQVMQGNDTDSFAATAGSILGGFFGPGSLDERWYAPFRDDVHTALALFHERSLEAITARMAALPERVSGA